MEQHRLTHLNWTEQNKRTRKSAENTGTESAHRITLECWVALIGETPSSGECHVLIYFSFI